MNRKTKKALEGSIEKWEKIVSGEGADNGVRNCLLCLLFNDNECKGCPVFKKVKDSGCDGTPYYDWLDHQDERHAANFQYKVECDECKELAQRELDFLKSL